MNEYAVTQTITHTLILQADSPDDAVSRYDELMVSPGFQPSEVLFGEPEVFIIDRGIDYPHDPLPSYGEEVA